MISELSCAEQQWLHVIWHAAHGGDAADWARIERLAREELGIVPAWDDAYARLLEKELVYQEGDRVGLTRRGQVYREQAEQAYPFCAYTYDAYFTYAAASQAHAKFCEQVYGRNLTQHGIADMVEIDKLIEVLGAREGQRLLDLGCGNGRIAEYVSDVSGAHVTGIDVSRVGIQQALERTQHKRGRLKFEAGNLNLMELPERTFDAIYFIDTLYFLEREPVIRRAQAALKPGGQMGFCYTQWWDEGDPKALLQAESTELAELLRRCGLRFETWDFSAAEDTHWQHKLDVLAELRPEFEDEGNMWLHEFRRHEAAYYVTMRSWENRSRHIYCAW
jgi:ubiquinone/menaquinone biosynthesis C-methylase UbiE